MKNTLETTETPGSRLDDLEARPDRVRGGVRGAGDHAVGQAQLDHQRAEVGDVGDHVARLVDRDAPCARAGARTPARTAPAAPASRGSSDRCAPSRSSAQPGRRAAHAVLVAEQGQVDDVAAQQDLRRAQDPLVGALGQDDVAPVGARAVEQLVLEHHRRDHRASALTAARSSSSAPSTQRSNRASAASSLRGASGRQAPEHRARERRRLVGVVRRERHRRKLRQALDQLQHGLRRAQAAGEHDTAETAGSRAEAAASSTPSRTSARSPGREHGGARR